MLLPACALWALACAGVVLVAVIGSTLSGSQSTGIETVWLAPSLCPIQGGNVTQYASYVAGGGHNSFRIPSTQTTTYSKNIAHRNRITAMIHGGFGGFLRGQFFGPRLVRSLQPIPHGYTASAPPVSVRKNIKLHALGRALHIHMQEPTLAQVQCAPPRANLRECNS